MKDYHVHSNICFQNVLNCSSGDKPPHKAHVTINTILICSTAKEGNVYIAKIIPFQGIQREDGNLPKTQNLFAQVMDFM